MHKQLVLNQREMDLLFSALTNLEYRYRGPLKIPPSSYSEKLLELLDRVRSSDIDIEQLT